MSDEGTTEGQDNTAPDEASEGNLVTQSPEPTEDGDEEQESPDQAGTETDSEGDDDGSDEGEGEGDDQNEEAPEYDDFNLPEGFEALDETLLAEAAPLFKENGLSQEEAQKFVDLYANAIKQQNEASLQAFTELNNKNKEAIENHPEFGGDKLEESSVDCARAIDVVMGDKAKEFRDLVNQTGLGNHPLMFELLTKVGKSINEDGIVDGRKAGTRPDAATVMYGKDGRGKAAET